MNARDGGPELALTIAAPTGGEITLRPFPHDGRFIRDIRRAAVAVSGSATSDGDLCELLQRALRAWYPHIEIRAREPLAGLSEDERLWYVMRDGKLGPWREQSDRLDAALSDPRATAVDADVAEERARAALAFAGQPRKRAVRETTAAPRGESVDER